MPETASQKSLEQRLEELKQKLVEHRIDSQKLQYCFSPDGQGVTTDIREVLKYLICFSEFKRVPIATIKVGKDFSLKGTLEDVYSQITGNKISFKEDPVPEFLKATNIGYNLAMEIDADLDPTNLPPEVRRFSNLARSLEQSNKVKVVAFSEKTSAIPSEIGLNLIAITKKRVNF